MHHPLVLLGLIFSGMILAFSVGLAAAFVPSYTTCKFIVPSENHGGISSKPVLSTAATYHVLQQGKDDAETSSQAEPTTDATKKRRQEIIDLLQSRSNDDAATTSSNLSPQWRKLRNYLYQTNLSTLPLSQVTSVISYLDSVLNSTQLTNTVLQTTPRIMRKSAQTQLVPTVEFLQSIYPQDLFLRAIERNPNLLVTSGVGYDDTKNSGVDDGAGIDGINVEKYLLTELGLSENAVARLKKSTPIIFQFSVEGQLRPVVGYLESILTTNGDNGDNHVTNADATIAIGKIIKSYPTVLGLSVESNLKPTVRFLTERCGFEKQDMAKIIKAYPGFLGLSLESNLRPTIDYIANVLLDYNVSDMPDDEAEEEFGMWLEDAREPLRKCISRHPPILGLAMDNLRKKVAYFDAIDSTISVDNALAMMGGGSTGSKNKKKEKGEAEAAKSLAGRVLLAAPSTYSLSLKDNIIPTIKCLAKFWGTDICLMIDANGNDAVRDENGCLRKPLPLRPNSLSTRLAEYPAVLTLSIEGNLRPTIEFYNKTGYVQLDKEGRLMPEADYSNGDEGSTIVRARYLATSLFNRLLPRWHYIKAQAETDAGDTGIGIDPLCDIDSESDDPCHEGEQRPPLYILAGSSDAQFCSKYDFDLKDYEEYRRKEGGKLKFNLQFTNWIKTGQPID